MNRKQLIEDNIRLVYHIIAKEYPTYIHDDDIIQSGMYGLCKAAQGWDEKRGLFSTYAGKWIRGEIRQEFSRRKANSKAVSLETSIGDDGTLGDFIQGDDDVAYIDDETFYRQLTNEEREVLKLHSSGYATYEIAERLGFSNQKVCKLLRITKIKWRNYYDY